MIWIYIICSIAVVHVLFLIYPVYRDEVLDIYSWKPWTEKNYVLFKSVTGNNKAVKMRLLINWLTWPFLCLFIIVMPIVDSIGINVPPVSETNVPLIAERNVPLVSD